MKLKAIFVGLVAILASCTVPIREDLKKEIDNIFNMMPRTTTHENTSIIPWAVGQWVLVRSVDSDGNRQVQRTSVVKKEGNGFWIETESTTYQDKTWGAMLIENYDSNKLSSMKVIKMKVRKSDGTVMDLNPDEGLGTANDAFVQIVQKIGTSGTNEKVTTAAGTFNNAKKTAITVNVRIAIMTATITGDYWFTYAVPVLYFAKADQQTQALFKNIKVQQEVVDFGMAGATSQFFK